MSFNSKMKNRRLLKNQFGFSMVEMMVSVLIFTLVSGSAYMVIRSGEMTWSVNNAKVELQQVRIHATRR